MFQLTCLTIHVLVSTNLTAYIQRKDPSLEFYQSPQRLAFNWIALSVLTGVFIYFRLWIMDFEQPIFKVMDNPVAAADSLLVRVCSLFGSKNLQSFSSFIFFV